MRSRPVLAALRVEDAVALLSAGPKADAIDLREAAATPQGLAAAFVALATAFAARGKNLEYMAILRARDCGLRCLRCTTTHSTRTAKNTTGGYAMIPLHTLPHQN